jgi:hypothetical protein
VRSEKLCHKSNFGFGSDIAGAASPKSRRCGNSSGLEGHGAGRHERNERKPNLTWLMMSELGGTDEKVTNLIKGGLQDWGE